MNRFQTWQLLLPLLLLLILAGCASGPAAGELIPIPTSAPPAAAGSVQSDPAGGSASLPPATAEPGAGQETAVDEGTSLDDAAVDEALIDIDESVCEEAARVRDDLDHMAEAGADIAELEEALADLLAELDNCPPAP